MPLEIDTSQNPKYLEFASKLTGVTGFEPCKTIAIRRNGALAVFVYNNQQAANISLTVAATGPEWCSRTVLKVLFGFPFLQLGLNRITTVVNEDNDKSISICDRTGFKRIGVLEQYHHDGRSVIIYGMTKDECGWL